jgi:lysophospholipase L1-like esterase
MQSKMLDIVMIGSSIFEFWGQPKWGKLTVENHAIRSTHSQDWLNKAVNGTLGNLPAARNILIYCGSNDLIYGHSPDQVVNNVCSLLSNLSELFPNTRLGYFSIMKCPQKSAAQQLALIQNINSRIEQFCHGKYDFLNFNEFIDNDEKWFIEDGLHLTDHAYEMLNEKLSPTLNKLVK